jgi:hypothetical protein
MLILGIETAEIKDLKTKIIVCGVMFGIILLFN